MSDKILLYNEPPRLVTERLILVHPNSKYAADLYEYGSRQDFVSSIGIPPQKSIDAAVEFIKFLSKENETHKRMYWVLVDKKSGVAIGTLGFIFTYAIHHRVAEFAEFHLLPAPIIFEQLKGSKNLVLQERQL